MSDQAPAQFPLEAIALDNIARICHEANRAYCLTIGDSSQLPYEQAPEWQQTSAMQGVVFHLEGDHGPEASHDAWRAAKLADGWKYGPVKDPKKKEHPCMVDFKDLPVAQQMKDHLFRAIVHAFKNFGGGGHG